MPPNYSNVNKVRAMVAAVLLTVCATIVIGLRPIPVEATTCAIGHGPNWGSVNCSIITAPKTQARAQISCDHGVGGGGGWVSAYGPWVNQGATSIAWCPTGYTRAFMFSYQLR